MRFGKRLAEIVAQNGESSATYVSYKELKQVLGEMARALSRGRSGSSSNNRPERDGDSSGDEGGALAAESAAGSSEISGQPFEVLHRQFYKRIDMDLDQAHAYVVRHVNDLELLVGDWQSSAVLAGRLYTPNQLRDVASQMPFAVKDQAALVRWLASFPAKQRGQDSPQGLVEKYTHIVNLMNKTLLYVEVNLMAVRKILKKFDKKLALDLGSRSSRDYTKHHDLVMTSLQDLVIVAMQMRRVVTDLAPSLDLRPELGPETVAVLTQLKAGLILEEASVAPRAAIDVYAKPTHDPPAHGTLQSAPSTASRAEASLVADAPARPSEDAGSLRPPPGRADAHGSAASLPSKEAPADPSRSGNNGNGRRRGPGQRGGERANQPQRGGRGAGRGSGRGAGHGGAAEGANNPMNWGEFAHPLGQTQVPTFALSPEGPVCAMIGNAQPTAFMHPYFLPLYSGGCYGRDSNAGRGGCGTKGRANGQAGPQPAEPHVFGFGALPAYWATPGLAMPVRE
eukprot:TRINITY_DN53974_c0_g1_i1.p1 TRINITY_DN53974_c0_g1~~TRINITY_DN53974_c0_g1_i1.p1  ORF type:complete len:522 (+),score=74.60 TRINITY_DN53974_c0_g1_i1:39-1568(+)